MNPMMYQTMLAKMNLTPDDAAPILGVTLHSSRRYATGFDGYP